MRDVSGREWYAHPNDDEMDIAVVPLYAQAKSLGEGIPEWDQAVVRSPRISFVEYDAHEFNVNSLLPW